MLGTSRIARVKASSTPMAGRSSRLVNQPSRPGHREDDVNATYKDGILEVSFPYKTDKPEQHRVAITRA